MSGVSLGSLGVSPKFKRGVRRSSSHTNIQQFALVWNRESEVVSLRCSQGVITYTTVYFVPHTKFPLWLPLVNCHSLPTQRAFCPREARRALPERDDGALASTPWLLLLSCSLSLHSRRGGLSDAQGVGYYSYNTKTCRLNLIRLRFCWFLDSLLGVKGFESPGHRKRHVRGKSFCHFRSL